MRVPTYYEHVDGIPTSILPSFLLPVALPICYLLGIFLAISHVKC